MSDDDKLQEAAELAKQAKGQGKAAAKNATRAAKIVTEPVVEKVAEEAQDTAHKLEGTIDDAAHAARRLDTRVLGHISSDTGQAFMALAVAIWAGTIAGNKFRAAAAGRKALMTRPID